MALGALPLIGAPLGLSRLAFAVAAFGPAFRALRLASVALAVTAFDPRPPHGRTAAVAGGAGMALMAAAARLGLLLAAAAFALSVAPALGQSGHRRRHRRRAGEKNKFTHDTLLP
jgi:hypothetical protein